VRNQQVRLEERQQRQVRGDDRVRVGMHDHHVDRHAGGQPRVMALEPAARRVGLLIERVKPDLGPLAQFARDERRDRDRR
jgi:hypothetical protein